MIITFIMWLIKSALSALFGLIGSLPFIGAGVSSMAIKFVGWGCYICGTSTISLLFVSIGGWALVFATLGVFRFIKTYIPLS